MKISCLIIQIFYDKNVQILYCFFTVTSNLKRQSYLSYVINYCKGHVWAGFTETLKRSVRE